MYAKLPCAPNNTFLSVVVTMQNTQEITEDKNKQHKIRKVRAEGY